MNLTLEDWILWAAGFIGVVLLLAALLRKGAAKVFPWFTAWCFYQLVSATTLFAIHLKGNYKAYYWTYWYGQIPEFLLLLCVIWNLAIQLFRARGNWKPGIKILLRIGVSVAVLVAFGLTWLGEPQTTLDQLRWTIRGTLFSAVLTTEIAGVVVLVAIVFGGLWKEWVTGLAIGLMMWFPIAFVVDVAHTYMGQSRFYANLAHAELYAELGAICYWIFAFSRKQPEPQPLPVKLEETIERLANMRWRP